MTPRNRPYVDGVATGAATCTLPPIALFDDSLAVKQLKAECKKRALKVSGRKYELIARLPRKVEAWRDFLIVQQHLTLTVGQVGALEGTPSGDRPTEWSVGQSFVKIFSALLKVGSVLYP